MTETNPTAVPPPATDSWAAIEAAVLLVIANDLVDEDVSRAAVELVSIAERTKRLAGAVPDPEQVRQQILQRDATFGAYIVAVCDAIGLPHDSPRAAVVEAIQAAVAAAQAPESPTESTPKAGRGGSGEAETPTDTGQAREPVITFDDEVVWLGRRYVAALNAVLCAPPGSNDVDRWRGHAEAFRQVAEQICRDLSRPAPPFGSEEWRAANGIYSEEYLAELREIVRRSGGPSGDTVQAPDAPDLAYARSEVDKWLASNAPYCILPTRTEHIPALLARLDELEGTS